MFKMPHMPKHLGGGPILLTLEQRYTTFATARDALAKLRERKTDGKWKNDLADIGSIAAVGPVKDYQFNPPSVMVTAGLKQHMKDHWFGSSDSAGKPTTGWWNFWKGEPENVLREALTRALEMSLGVRHGAPLPGTGAAPKPIQFFWVCGLPRFECYVSWNSVAVTVVILTPGWYATLGPDQPADSDAALTAWVDANPNGGMIFVGQNVQTDGAVVEMAPGVVVHHMDIKRDGRGSPFDGTAY
jgi:hypothetical protein